MRYMRASANYRHCLLMKMRHRSTSSLERIARDLGIPRWSRWHILLLGMRMRLAAAKERAFASRMSCDGGEACVDMVSGDVGKLDPMFQWFVDGRRGR